MRRGIIRQDQYGRPAIAHEIACYGPDEVGLGAVHLGQKFVDHLHHDVGPALDQIGAPALDVVLVRVVGQLRPESAGLRQHGCDDTIRRPLQKVPNQGTTDAEAHHHELVDS